MQGQSINTPLDPSTHLTDPFNNANETKTAEVKFCAYPKSSLINENQESVCYLVERMKSQNCNEAISSNNQTMLMLSSAGNSMMKSISLEQRVDALIKK